MDILLDSNSNIQREWENKCPWLVQWLTWWPGMSLGPGSIPAKDCQFSTVHWEVTVMSWHCGWGWGFPADVLGSNSYELDTGTETTANFNMSTLREFQ